MEPQSGNAGMMRGSGVVDGIVAVVLVAVLLATVALLRPEAISGLTRVVDGDTLAMAGRRIRLTGLDAPELAQTCERGGARWRCGEEARDALRRLVLGAPVTCSVSGRDRYGRDLATCAVAGLDLGAALVRRGMAVASGAYRSEEREARAAGAGVWSGSFEQPADWRRRQAEHRPP